MLAINCKYDAMLLGLPLHPPNTTTGISQVESDIAAKCICNADVQRRRQYQVMRKKNYPFFNSQSPLAFQQGDWNSSSSCSVDYLCAYYAAATVVAVVVDSKNRI